MKIKIPRYEKDNRGGDQKKNIKESEKVNWTKKPLSYVEYIDLMRKTVVNDVINNDKHYKSFTQLIRGMNNNLATNPDRRLPVEKTQRDYERIYVYGKATGNEENVKYPVLVEKCMRDYSKERLIELMRNESFEYDISYYDRKESPSIEYHPNVIFFTPENKEHELTEHFKLFFTDTIKAIIIGYKCLVIYFEDYEKLETFVEQIVEFLGERKMIKKDENDDVQECDEANKTEDEKYPGQDEGEKKAEENG